MLLCQPTITTNEIDKAVHKMIIDAGAYPSPLGYGGFPKSVCTSVNECMCHGIPDSRRLQVLEFDYHLIILLFNHIDKRHELYNSLCKTLPCLCRMGILSTLMWQSIWMYVPVFIYFLPLTLCAWLLTILWYFPILRCYCSRFDINFDLELLL